MSSTFSTRDMINLSGTISSGFEFTNNYIPITTSTDFLDYSLPFISRANVIQSSIYFLPTQVIF